MASMRVYRCGDHLKPGETFRRPRGLSVGTTIGHAIGLWANREGAEYGTNWPVRVFEGTVDDDDLLDALDGGEGGLRVRALHVEREVAACETLGPRADDVARFVDDVDHIRWLRPQTREGMDARVTELVGEHYAALRDYGAVSTPPVELVRTWHEARDRHDQIQRRPDAETTAINLACSVRGNTTAAVGAQLAQHKLTRSAYFGAWNAAWSEAGRSAATGISASGPLGPFAALEEHYRLATALRAVDGMVKALGAAREAAWQGGWDAAYDLFTYAPGNVPAPEVMFRQAIAEAQRAFDRHVPDKPIHSLDCAVCREGPGWRKRIIAGFILRTCEKVFTAAVTAAQLVGWRAAYLVNVVPRADPWRPLIDIWRLGGWPLGPTEGSYLVFLPQPKS